MDPNEITMKSLVQHSTYTVPWGQACWSQPMKNVSVMN